jgi:hypothetical protein
MNKFNLPNFLCLDRIVGPFFSRIIKIVVFVAIIYFLGLEMWKRYGNKKEGLTPGDKTKTVDEDMKNPGTNNANQPSPNDRGMKNPGTNNANQPSPIGKITDPIMNLFPDLIDIPKTGIIPDGYYKILIKNKPELLKMRPIPTGCKLKIDSSKLPKGSNVDPKTSGIVPITSSGNYSEDETKCANVIDIYKSDGEFKKSSTVYDASNMDDYKNINPELRGSEKEARQTVFDVSLNLIHPYPVYYEPGSFPFASTGYLPTYEDSIYISKTTNLSQATPITKAPYLQGGFCKQYANDDQTRNAKCNALGSETCASTECCVLVGGTKCVAGNEGGPTIKSVFSDVTIPNKDYWYYQGKCMGNCP